jgi:hypothetical protein
MLFMGRFSKLEKWIEQLVEEPFVRLFSGRLLPQEVVRHLVHALEDGEILTKEGYSEVPGRYTIFLHPLDLAALRQDHPELEEQLQSELEHIANKMGVRLHEPPEITLYEDATLAQQSVRISPVIIHAPRIERTRDMDVSQMRKLLEQGTTSAYLIVAGSQTVDLRKPIIRIGRALDNDIILEDRRVSRYHAQLRQRYGRYLLHDMDSTGGTMVNGYRVKEIVLRAGDTISLSGVDIIYAEDEPIHRQSKGQTQSMPTD